MNKKIILFVALFGTLIISAQNFTDALRIANSEVRGTARYCAMGGAFGALGGDLSAVGINPASSAVFNSTLITTSLALDAKTINTSYFRTKNEAQANSFGFNQVGAVFVGEDKDSDWSRFSFALNYNRDNNLKEEYFIQGRNTNASIISYFKNIADDALIPLDLVRTQAGETIDDLYQYLGENESFDAQQVFLGYNGYILDPLDAADANNTTYNVADNYLSSDQEMSVLNKGFNSKFTINLGAAYKKKTYLGMSLHLLSYEFEETTKFTEKGVGATYLKEIKFDNYLTTKGDGIQFSFGVIHRITDAIRIGLTYDSPKFYTITDELSQSLETVRDDAGSLIRQTVDPITVNVYPEYKLQVPSKVTASMAIVVGKKGLISGDYSYQNQANIKMKPTSDFVGANADISSNLKGVSTFKLGTEWRFDALSIRGGYVLKQSPYKNTAVQGDYISYSAGIGYKFDGVTIDMSYIMGEYTDSHQFYTTGLTNAALLNKKNNQLVVSAKFVL